MPQALAITAAMQAHDAIQDQLTANFQSFEDFIQRPGKLREDLSSLAGTGLVTPAALDAEARVRAEWATDAQAFNAYVATLPALNATLRAGGYAEVPLPKALAL